MDNKEKQSLYIAAKKRVDKIKGFYNHLVVYLIVNILIIYANIGFSSSKESIFQFHIFSTAIFWGVGLLAHGLDVFAVNLLFGKKWEERKIKEIMEKNKENSENECV